MASARLTVTAAALAIAGTAAFLLTRAPAQPPPAEPPAPSGAAPRVGRAVAPEHPSLVGPADPAVPAGAAVKLRGSQRVASVNGTAITGRQLLAWRAGDPAEQEMTPEMFAALKGRAIERELTFAEARRQGIDLGPAQLAQLQLVRKNAEARGETDVAQLDFEETDARAHLLAAALLEKAGVAGPLPTEADVKRYQEEHADELDALPEDPAAREPARKKLEAGIRQALALELGEEHQEALRAYFDRLRAGARIVED